MNMKKAHSFDLIGNLPASLLMNEDTKYLGGLTIALGSGNSMEAREFLEDPTPFDKVEEESDDDDEVGLSEDESEDEEDVEGVSDTLMGEVNVDVEEGEIIPKKVDLTERVGRNINTGEISDRVPWESRYRKSESRVSESFIAGGHREHI
ncbi:unnamed protein product [Lactuca saligna]|uniref:Uncharacterized protein n=1 Tax=Lactuca saligna TaxID=75948 RepID=A0AA35UK80_LACSI|nr:unnamed protein product [Lactuca saligna]